MALIGPGVCISVNDGFVTRSSCDNSAETLPILPTPPADNNIPSPTPTPPSLSIDDTVVNEGGIATLDVVLSKVWTNVVTVQYESVNGTAVAPDDYTSVSGMLTFNPGELDKQINITTHADGALENDEVFFVRLTMPTNASISKDIGTVTIQDTPLTCCFEVGDIDDVLISVGTNNSFATAMNIADGFNVAYNAAIIDEDGVNTSNIIPHATIEVISSGTPDTQFFVFEVCNDNSIVIFNIDGSAPDMGVYLNVYDEAQTLIASEGAPAPYILGNLQFSGTLNLLDDIVNVTLFDFATPTIASGGTGDFAGVSGTTITSDIDISAPGGVIYSIGGFDFTLDSISDVVTDPLACEGGLCQDSRGFDMTGTVSGNSFTTTTFQGVFLASGTCLEGIPDQCENGTQSGGWVSSVQVQTPYVDPFIQMILDAGTYYVSADGFFKNGAGPYPCTLYVSVECGDYQLPATIKIDGVLTYVGSTAILTVSLYKAVSYTVTVEYETVDGTAVSPTDYIAVSGTLTFAPGETSKIIEVDILTENIEFVTDKDFTVNLSNATNSEIRVGTGIVIILNPQLSFASLDELVIEGSVVTLDVTLSPPSDVTVTIDYATVNGTGIAGVDYVATSGTLTFNPGITTQSIDVTTLDDSENDGDRTFTVVLSDPVNGWTTGTPSTITVRDYIVPVAASLVFGDNTISYIDGISPINGAFCCNTSQDKIIVIPSGYGLSSYSTDGGTSFTPQALPSSNTTTFAVRHMQYDAGLGDFWVLVRNSSTGACTYYYSSTDGASWSSRASSGSMNYANSFYVQPDGVLYMASRIGSTVSRLYRQELPKSSSTTTTQDIAIPSSGRNSYAMVPIADELVTMLGFTTTNTITAHRSVRTPLGVPTIITGTPQPTTRVCASSGSDALFYVSATSTTATFTNIGADFSLTQITLEFWEACSAFAIGYGNGMYVVTAISADNPNLLFVKTAPLGNYSVWTTARVTLTQSQADTDLYLSQLEYWGGSTWLYGYRAFRPSSINKYLVVDKFTL